MFIVTLVNCLYRILMLSSSTCRKKKLKWDVLSKKVDKKHDFLLDFICTHHCDFLLFENFNQNFNKIVVRKTLKKVCEHHEEEMKRGLIEKSEYLKHFD